MTVGPGVSLRPASRPGAEHKGAVGEGNARQVEALKEKRRF